MADYLKSNPTLLHPLPTLQIAPFIADPDERKTVTDPRTGIEYLVNIKEGFLKYLRDNLIDVNVDPISLPAEGESLDTIEAKLLSLKVQEKLTESIALEKALNWEHESLLLKENITKKTKAQQLVFL